MLSNGTSELKCMSLSLSVKCCGIPGRPFRAIIRLLHTSKAGHQSIWSISISERECNGESKPFGGHLLNSERPGAHFSRLPITFWAQ